MNKVTKQHVLTKASFDKFSPQVDQCRIGQAEPDYSHRVFKNDPVHLATFLGQRVEIKTVTNDVSRGTVLTVDPVTESWVLVEECEEHLSCTVVMGSCVDSVTVVAGPVYPIQQLFPGCLHSEARGVDSRGSQLKQLLEQHLIPVEMEGDVLAVHKAVFIHPPYTHDSIVSRSEVVLERIIQIMDKLPQHLNSPS